MYWHALLLNKIGYKKKLLLPLLVIVPTITQYLINNILLRFLRMFLKFAEQVQLCNIYKT